MISAVEHELGSPLDDLSREDKQASLAGLRALVAHADEAGIDVRGRRALVLCAEGATDPVAYERIVGAPPPPDVR